MIGICKLGKSLYIYIEKNQKKEDRGTIKKWKKWNKEMKKSSNKKWKKNHITLSKVWCYEFQAPTCTRQRGDTTLTIETTSTSTQSNSMEQ